PPYGGGRCASGRPPARPPESRRCVGSPRTLRRDCRGRRSGARLLLLLLLGLLLLGLGGRGLLLLAGLRLGRRGALLGALRRRLLLALADHLGLLALLGRRAARQQGLELGLGDRGRDAHDHLVGIVHEADALDRRQLADVDAVPDRQ